MDKRLKLHNILIAIVSKNVYYQPPENIKIEYPCLLYYMNDMDIKKANNTRYVSYNRYTITYISKKIDDKIVDLLLQIPLSSFDRQYISDGLHHVVLTIYI